jgi:Mg2+-importing ATPase
MIPDTYWAFPPRDLLSALDSTPDGLSSTDAADRRRRFGSNVLQRTRRVSRVTLAVRQVRSPLVLLLLAAALVAGLGGEWLDVTIVLVVVAGSAALGSFREFRAESAAAALQARLHLQANVSRDGRLQSVPAADLVPGDVVALAAGSLVPADGVVLSATDFYVSEAVLTGESFPVQKHAGTSPSASPLVQRRNCVFQGTNVRSGTARCLIVRTGASTAFGRIARTLKLRAPETEFERGLRHFGQWLITTMFVMTLAIVISHGLLGRPPRETLLFALALAVGLSPELLPAILAVNLARSAQMMAGQGVLVRRLNAIENLGSMDVLCTDKTGTLTEGVIELEGAYDPSGTRSDSVLRLAVCNATLQTGIASPLDDAIVSAASAPVSETKVGEVPYDFVRKRASVAVRDGPTVRLVTKGAFSQVLAICTTVETAPLDGRARQLLEQRCDEWTSRGLRVLAVASRPLDEKSSYDRSDETVMSFAGFLTFLDRPRSGVKEALADLRALGVAVKVISGDSRRVAEHVATLVDLPSARVLTGRDLDELHDDALWSAAPETDLFVEVDPNQKERIILALKKTGHVVGFLGDGVNDAPAMHAADASLSVANAVDVAREAADFVLLERGLRVVCRGIDAGRRTFANTFKYVLLTMSANLGNMLSMAGAAVVLPFLPLTAGQILLNNFLSDIPAAALAGDGVDAELVARPRRWDMRLLTRYMVEFGALSSVFDLLTFVMLLEVYDASPETFRTGWFVESLLTELLVVFVIRTTRPFVRSRPGRPLVALTLAVAALALVLPYVPAVRHLGFVPLERSLMFAIGTLSLLYVAAAEWLKAWFFRGVSPSRARPDRPR